MCCILYVPAGVETPSIETLQSVYIFNRNGMGFCDSNGNHFHSLGFNAFAKEVAKRDINAHLIIHFRLATHGSVKLGNCHPFHDERTGVWFAHNGVLPIESKNDKTDSEIFFRSEFLPIYDMLDNNFNDPYLWEIVDSMRYNSRFIFMKGDEVVRLGRWHVIDGVYYSNLNWCYGR